MRMSSRPPGRSSELLEFGKPAFAVDALQDKRRTFGSGKRPAKSLEMAASGFFRSNRLSKSKENRKKNPSGKPKLVARKSWL